MSLGLSDKVRTMARAKYVNPAIRAGKFQFSIKVRDLLCDLQAEGFPTGHTPQVCSALQTSKFLRENGLEIESVEGPPSKTSPTVIVRYRVTRPAAEPTREGNWAEAVPATFDETPEARALRLTEGLRGLLKEEMAEFGGAEGFLRWVRGYDEEDAA